MNKILTIFLILCFQLIGLGSSVAENAITPSLEAKAVVLSELVKPLKKGSIVSVNLSSSEVKAIVRYLHLSDYEVITADEGARRSKTSQGNQSNASFKIDLLISA